MSSTAQSLSLAIAIIVSFFWASVPSLRPYSSQITAGLFILYFIVKHLSGGLKTNALMPGPLTIETAILTTALLIIVWFTGGIGSIFLPVLYFLLFLGMFVLDFNSLTLLILLIPTYLWATADHALSTHELATIASFLVMLPLLLFAKTQYQQAKEEKKVAESLQEKDYDSTLFLKTYLKPKLQQLEQLTDYPEQNTENISKQTKMLMREIEEHLESL